MLNKTHIFFLYLCRIVFVARLFSYYIRLVIISSVHVHVKSKNYLTSGNPLVDFESNFKKTI